MHGGPPIKEENMSVFHEQHQFMTTTQQKPNASLYLELVKEEVVHELLPAWERYRTGPTSENLTEVVDGAIDGIYVLAGLLNSLIGPDKAKMCWDEVQRSNMSKVGPDGVKFREDGKVLKPVTYFPPDLFSILVNIK